MWGRVARVATGAVAAVALLAPLTGCGGSQANDPRAPNPIQTTVSITDQKVVVSPNRFGFGEQQGLVHAPSAAEVQAENAGETVTATVQEAPPKTDADQILVFSIANLSGHEATLQIKGPVEATSDVIPAGGTGNMQVAFKTGEYVVTAEGDFNPKPGKISMGPERHSAQNDLLLP
jgi:hypothetical protein